MSYILDALKKAAEQRDAHAPAMRRLFSPVPEFTESPRWRLAAVGGAAAIAGAVVAVWVLWPARSVTETSVPAPAMARAQTDVTARAKADVTPRADVTPAAPSPAPAPPATRTAPKPPTAVRAVPEKEPAPVVQTRQAQAETAASAPAVPARSAPVESVAPAPVPPARPAPADSAPARPQPAPSAPVIAAVRPAPFPAAVTPPAGTPARTEAGAPMRLEVIVYSDERTRRLAFINGRKYVEGDQLLDGARIQEIQPNAVILIDDGRRVVLKP